MKKLTITIMSTFIAFTALAQDTSVVYKPSMQPKHSYAFTFEPFQMFTGGFFVAYQQLLKNKKILQFRTGVRLAEQSGFYQMNDVTEFQFETQYRVMVAPNHNPLSGIYISPFLGFKAIGYREVGSVIVTPNPNGGSTFDSPGLSAQAVSFGFTMGIQRIFRSGFVFDIGFGGGIQLPFGDYEQLSNGGGSVFDPYHKGVIPKGTVNFGVAF